MRIVPFPELSLEFIDEIENAWSAYISFPKNNVFSSFTASLRYPRGGRSIRERYKIKVESVHIGPSLVRCVVSPVFWCHMRSGGPMAIEIFIGFEGETATSYRSTSYFCLLFLAVSLLKNSWLNFLSGLSLSRHRSAARGDRGEA